MPRTPQRRARARDLVRDDSPELLAAMGAVFGEVEKQSHDVLLQDRPEIYYPYVATG